MPAHRIPEEKRNGVLRLWFEERVRNAAEIARKVGVSRPTVDKIIREEENRRKTAAGALAPVAVAPEQTVPAAAELESAAVITALISINLALINLIPVPALDGGRLLIIIIESVIRRPVSPKLITALSLSGFALLIMLMLVVTYHDIAKLVG